MSEETPEMKHSSNPSDDPQATEDCVKPEQDDEQHDQHQEQQHQQHEVELGLNDDQQSFEDEFQSDDHYNHQHHSSANTNNKTIVKVEETKQNQDEEEEDQDCNNVLVASVADDTGLYDDVMAEPTPNLSFSNDSLNAVAANASATPLPSHLSATTTPPSTTTAAANLDTDSKTLNVNTKTYAKRVSCYVGNLTWWTTDHDLSTEIQKLGVNDLLEIKFYENKVNGQSKGFAMVTVGSDQSFRHLMEKLPKKQLNGQEPLVTHYSRHYFNQFEEQARKDMPSTAGNSSNNSDSFNPHQSTASFHHYNSNNITSSGSHLNGNNTSIGNNNSSNNNNQLHSQPIMQNRIRTNSYPVTSSSSATSTASLNNGLIGHNSSHSSMSLNNRSLNNTLRPQGASLAGSYPMAGSQPLNNINSNQIRMPLAQQPMGIMPNPPVNSTSLINNYNRQLNNHFPASSVNSSQYSSQRPMLPNQQTSLLGNRPPLLSSQPMLRPSLAANQPQQSQQSHVMNHGMSLLNNPRMPPIQHNQANNPMQLTRQDSWDNRLNNNSNTNINNNPMLMMNNQRSQQAPITPTSLPGANSQQFSYSSVHNNNNNNSNGILPMNNSQPLLPNNSFQSFQQTSLHQNVYNSSQQHQQQQQQHQQQQLAPGMSSNLNHHMNHLNAHPAMSQPSLSLVDPHLPGHHLTNQHHLQNHHSHPSLANQNHTSNPMQQQQQQQHSTQIGLGSSSSSSLIGGGTNDLYSTYQRTNSANSLLDHHHHLQQQQQQQQQHLKLNEIEFQEALEKNRIISGSALSRAVQDATLGQYQSALDTLQTAISLIKQSKISQDERCKLLISTLQDTKKGIEDRYYSTSSSGSLATNGHMLPHLGVSGSGRGDSSSSRADSRDRDRLKRSRSRDSRSRDSRDRDREHRSSKRGGGTENRAEKHHRSSHRDRSRERSRANGAVSSSGGGGGAGSDYYDDQPQHSSSRYHHRSRH